MKSSRLNSFFKGQISIHHLKNDLRDEVFSYVQLMTKKGTSVPLKFHENEKVFINSASIKTLLREVLLEKLTKEELAYICDCLTLGEKVQYENEKVRDIIFEISDPEINGGFKSKINIQAIIDNEL